MKNLRQFYDWYSFRMIPRFGATIARDRDSYVYLVESIRKFPAPRTVHASDACGRIRKREASQHVDGSGDHLLGLEALTCAGPITSFDW